MNQTSQIIEKFQLLSKLRSNHREDTIEQVQFQCFIVKSDFCLASGILKELRI